eukprot:TRINITY_DN2464_c0_g1_i1.p1 TRINITY_DN2464_c0_g1~~TRINITY_DN2464_c0_g1_i1.p1  ORF type:complete len:537 (-),score=121.55 TRINITY_DN2464_c0_g1_i1:362-1972(-)
MASIEDSLLPQDALPSEKSADEKAKISVGFHFREKRVKSLFTPELIERAATEGIEFVQVDPDRLLMEQGPFDLLLHKMKGEAWESQLDEYIEAHPHTVLIDPYQAVARMDDRSVMLKVVEGLDSADLGVPVTAPKQLLVPSGLAPDDIPRFVLEQGGLRLPLVAKPASANGNDSAHELALVLSEKGLAHVELPTVVQEFVNHGGVLFKLYVLGDYVMVAKRQSLPDIPQDSVFQQKPNPKSTSGDEVVMEEAPGNAKTGVSQGGVKNSESSESGKGGGLPIATMAGFPDDATPKPNEETWTAHEGEDADGKAEGKGKGSEDGKPMAVKLQIQTSEVERLAGRGADGAAAAAVARAKASGAGIIALNRISNVHLADAELDSRGVADPSPELMQKLGLELKKRLGLRAFNVDILREGGTQDSYIIVDINYMPGYEKLPDFTSIFVDFIKKQVGKRRFKVSISAKWKNGSFAKKQKRDGEDDTEGQEEGGLAKPPKPAKVLPPPPSMPYPHVPKKKLWVQLRDLMHQGKLASPLTSPKA